MADFKFNKRMNTLNIPLAIQGVPEKKTLLLDFGQ